MSRQRFYNRQKCHYLLMVAFAFFVVACGGGRSPKSASSAEGGLTFSLLDTLHTDTLHFGKVRAGEVVERSFALRNSSAQPLIILGTETSCGCLALDYPQEPIASGESRQVKMTFYSSGYNYFVPRAFYITTSASATPKRILVTADME